MERDQRAKKQGTLYIPFPFSPGQESIVIIRNIRSIDSPKLRKLAW